MWAKGVTCESRKIRLFSHTSLLHQRLWSHVQHYPKLNLFHSNFACICKICPSPMRGTPDLEFPHFCFRWHMQAILPAYARNIMIWFDLGRWFVAWDPLSSGIEFYVVLRESFSIGRGGVHAHAPTSKSVKDSRESATILWVRSVLPYPRLNMCIYSG